MKTVKTWIQETGISRSFFVLLGTALVFLLPASAAAAVELTPLESLGKAIFFDPNLSVNRTQSCASCHDPGVGFMWI